MLGSASSHVSLKEMSDRRVVEVNLRGNGERLSAPTWRQRGFRFIIRLILSSARKKSGANVYLRGFVLPSGAAVVFSDALLSAARPSHFPFISFLCFLLSERCSHVKCFVDQRAHRCFALLTKGRHLGYPGCFAPLRRHLADTVASIAWQQPSKIKGNGNLRQIPDL